MATEKVVLITGASGNLGSKLRQHLEGRYSLRLLDIDPRGDLAITQVDLSAWDLTWVDQFLGADVVVHLAADPCAHQNWPKLIGPNFDGTIHVFQAAVLRVVKRLIYASSNHVMGGYKDDPQATRLTTILPPRPGAHYVVDGEKRDSTPYGCGKLFGERLCKCFSEAYGLSAIALRIGWVRPGDNRPEDVPPARGPWFRDMWLSNRDFCQLVERCILAGPELRFAVLNGMSNNTGMRWDIEDTRRILGYEPQDDVTRISR
jgi:uronate dehydrogenase